MALLGGACSSASDDDAVAAGGDDPAAATPPSAETVAEEQAPPEATDAADEYAGFTDEDVIAVVELLDSGFHSYDEDAYLAATSADYRFIDERGIVTRDQQVTFIPTLRDIRQSAETLSDYTITGDGPFTVTVESLITATVYPPEGRLGLSTFTVVVEDGTLKVAELRWTGDPL